jgi:hypothetical protein
MSFRYFCLLGAFVSSSAFCGQWRYESSVDKMTGKKSESAMVISDNSLSLQMPYAGNNHGTLIVRRHPTYGLDVIVTVDKGQILCRSYDGCKISLKFDEGKPQRFAASPAADHSSEVVFIDDKKRFITSAKKAKQILVQFPMYQAGEPVLEFSVPVELVWK